MCIIILNQKLLLGFFYFFVNLERKLVKCEVSLEFAKCEVSIEFAKYKGSLEGISKGITKDSLNPIIQVYHIKALFEAMLIVELRVWIKVRENWT